MNDNDLKNVYDGVVKTLNKVKNSNFDKHRLERKDRSLDKFNDNEIFRELSFAVFSAGMGAIRPDTIKMIEKEFEGFNIEKIASFKNNKIIWLLDHFQAFRRYGKIIGIIRNAERVVELKKEYGSFKNYIRSFNNNIEYLRSDLIKNFNFIASASAYEFLCQLGFPCVKPDRAVQRVFWRLNLISHKDPSAKAEDEIQVIAKKLAKINETNLCEIDFLFWEFGRRNRKEYKNSFICIKEKPNCQLCCVTNYCGYRKKTETEGV